MRVGNPSASTGACTGLTQSKLDVNPCKITAPSGCLAIVTPKIRQELTYSKISPGTPMDRQSESWARPGAGFCDRPSAICDSGFGICVPC